MRTSLMDVASRMELMRNEVHAIALVKNWSD